MEVQRIRAPNGLWATSEARRKFLEKLAKELGVKQHSDWGKIRGQEIQAKGGRRVLAIHKNSVISLLRSTYPEIEWKKEWFKHAKDFPYRHWTKKENRRKFFDLVSKKFNIKHPSEWGRIKKEDIMNIKGGNGVLYYYKNSLRAALKSEYPGFNKLP